MNKVVTTLFSAIFLFSAHLSAQLYLTIKAMPSDNLWGVYVKPCDTLQCTNQTITGTGQITIVAKVGSAFSELTQYSGTWIKDTPVISPVENPDMVYFTLGLATDMPAITYIPGEETLLFTFKFNSPDGSPPALINNETDPFAQLPNSLGSNPGNDLSAVDFGTSPLQYYNYSGLYSDEHPVSCSQDGPTTSTSEVPAAHAAVIYPNPATNRLVLEAAQATFKQSTATLWDANMIQVMSLNLLGKKTAELDIERLPAGMYLLTIQADGQIVQTEKFFKGF